MDSTLYFKNKDILTFNETLISMKKLIVESMVMK